MPAQPDFDGFAEAQVTLREKFGRDILFYTPQAATYASGVQLDPETGRPYDPTIDPIASGVSTATVRCNVVSRPIAGRLGAEVSSEAIGWLEQGNIVLIVNTEDFASIEDATEFDYADERYEVRKRDHDYLGPVDRWLIWGAQF